MSLLIVQALYNNGGCTYTKDGGHPLIHRSLSTMYNNDKKMWENLKNYLSERGMKIWYNSNDDAFSVAWKC